MNGFACLGRLLGLELQLPAGGRDIMTFLPSDGGADAPAFESFVESILAS